MRLDTRQDGVAKAARRWPVTVLVLASGWLLLYATRTVLSSAVKEIGDYWGLSQSWLGILGSAFFMSYMFLQIPGGMLADRIGPRRALISGFMVQSLGLLLGSASQNHIQFLLSRVLTGAGQATYFACQQSIVSMAVPEERKALGVSITTAGAGLGSAAGFMLGKVLSKGGVGWRMPFAVLGVVSLLFVGAVLALIPERPPVKRESCEGSVTPARGALGVSPRFLAYMCGAHFFTMYGFYLMLTWLPYYLEAARGLTGSLPATIPVAMALALAPSAVAGGLIADRSVDKTKVARIAIPLSSIAILMVPLTGSTASLVAVLALYGFTGKLVVDPGLVRTVADVSPEERRGVVLSVFNFAGAVAMTLAPALTGFVAQATGSFNTSFYFAGILGVLGLSCLIAGLRESTRLTLPKDAQS